MKEELGVVIGRFQPFHKGHVWLIRKALENCEKIIIIIGSSNNKDDNNPWSLETRTKILEEFIRHEKIENKILRIENVHDVPDDDDWLELILKKIGSKKFMVVGDNNWVCEIFQKKGYRVLRPGYYNRNRYEGTKIRDLIKKNGKWDDRVPDYASKWIKE